MSEPVQMPMRCPLCDTSTDPADLHVKATEAGETYWSYECLGCGGVEKPTAEWIEIHEAQRGKPEPRPN
jgi:hypothetical protein